jgi:hypothetical protein
MEGNSNLSSSSCSRWLTRESDQNTLKAVGWPVGDEDARQEKRCVGYRMVGTKGAAVMTHGHGKLYRAFGHTYGVCNKVNIYTD